MNPDATVAEVIWTLLLTFGVGMAFGALLITIILKPARPKRQCVSRDAPLDGSVSVIVAGPGGGEGYGGDIRAGMVVVKTIGGGGGSGTRH